VYHIRSSDKSEPNWSRGTEEDRDHCFQNAVTILEILRVLKSNAGIHLVKIYIHIIHPDKKDRKFLRTILYSEII
jgi:hypothetical protein